MNLRRLPPLLVALFGLFILGNYWWHYKVETFFYDIPLREFPILSQFHVLTVPMLLLLILLAPITIFYTKEG